jgi:hypothetical protein
MASEFILVQCVSGSFEFPRRRDVFDRGRENRLNSVPPPSEPDRRISRIRLSSGWFYLEEE